MKKQNLLALALILTISNLAAFSARASDESPTGGEEEAPAAEGGDAVKSWPFVSWPIIRLPAPPVTRCVLGEKLQPTRDGADYPREYAPTYALFSGSGTPEQAERIAMENCQAAGYRPCTPGPCDTSLIPRTPDPRTPVPRHP